MKTWTGQKPKHSVSIKIDGIQAFLSEGQVVSRSLKPLYNIDSNLLEEGKKYEVFLGSFDETSSVLRTINHHRKVKKEELYEISPNTDERIILPVDVDIMEVFEEIVKNGGEGLVIDQSLKLKKIETYDVKVTGIVEGKGKFKGMLGALSTARGRVGTGFTEAERKLNWNVGDVIEVSCMSITKNGMFRLPRFVRLRWDKTLPLN